jgi:hypothetical protein
VSDPDSASADDRLPIDEPAFLRRQER